MITGEKIPRFWSKVLVAGTNGRCWNWQGSKRDGYGIFHTGRSMANAHRVAWEFMVGPIPKGMLVLHKCDNRACCNPKHLFLGTIQDNMDDRNRKMRQAHGIGNWNATLTDAQVRHIRTFKSFKRGEAKALAAYYGVTTGTLYHVRTRRSWRHL